MCENLERKHGQKPVHTIEDIKLLANLFPKEICCVCGLLNGKVEVGTLLFMTSTSYHAQYIASSETGYIVSGLDAVFEYCIKQAHENNKRWFDFGISTENAGLLLNNGLYQFKSEFGGGGFVQEFYELNF